VTARADLSPGLEDLARLAGVQTGYRAYDGTEHRVDEAVLVGVLRALGVGLDDAAGAPAALAALRRERATDRLAPVVAHRIGLGDETPVAIPAAAAPGGSWLTLELEDGTRRRERLAELLDPGSARPTVRLSALAGGALPPGYHELVLEGPGAEQRALVIAAPRCPAATRGWGLFHPLYSLSTEGDWGVGNYGSLAELGRFTRASGGSILGTLPLYPAFLEPPADPSPYLPVTRLGYQELYIDLAAVPELAAVDEARRALESPAVAEGVAAARRSPTVAYEALEGLHRSVLQPLADALAVGRAGQPLRDFADAHPELEAYARFRAAGERHGRDWRRWPAAVKGEGRAALEDPAARRHLCAQWLAWRQLEAAAEAAPLYGDLPVGVHPNGFDPYSTPEAFAPLAHGGAPPDPFFALGQDWAFAPLHPVALRETRYRYLIDVLRVAFAAVVALRVDHVMGLHRLYWIPEGFDARHGAYVTYPADELRALVALEAHRAGAVVVGEDLGTVDPLVRTAMDRDGMLRSFVLEFATSAATPLPSPPAGCIASWGSHDLPRFAAFYRGAAPGAATDGGRDRRSDAERAAWRAELATRVASDPELRAFAERPGSSGQPPEERAALAACLAHLAGGPADLVLVDVGDLLGDDAQENRPGTGVEADNWRHRTATTLEAIRTDPEVAALLALVDSGRKTAVTPEAACVP